MKGSTSPFQMQSTSLGRIRIFESYIIMTGELFTKAVLHVSGTPEPLEDECSSYLPTSHFPKTVELFELVASKVPTTTSPVTTLTVVPAITTSTETSQEPTTVTVTKTQTKQVSEPGPVPGFGIEALMALIVIIPILHRVKRKK